MQMPVTMHGAVAVLTLDGAGDGNTMSEEMLTRLVEVTGDLADDPDLAGVVITGTGRSFCTGGDLRAYRRVVDEDDIDIVGFAESFTAKLAAAILNVQRIGCPVTAAVNGQAAGAGFSLALACDYRIAAPRASFNFAYGRIGASTDGGMAWLLPRVVGPARAVQLLLEQPVLRARQAQDEGVVAEVVDAGLLVETCVARLQELRLVAPHAQSSAKRLVQSSMCTPLAEHLEMERAAFAKGLRTADMRHGVEALLSGEWPSFTGR